MPRLLLNYLNALAERSLESTQGIVSTFLP
jgi:hypothetical protein